MKKYYILMAVLFFGANHLLQAQAVKPSFTEGGIVVYRIGPNAGDPRAFDLGKSNSAPLFVDEYVFDEDGLLEEGKSVALPEETVGSNISCVAVPSATWHGYLSRSQCGRYIVLGGYEAFKATSGTDYYQSSWGYLASQRRRVMARIDVDGNVNTTTALTDAYSKKDIRGVASLDGTQFWITGDNDTGSGDGLTRYTVLGASTSVKVESLTGRGLQVVNNKLYALGQERMYQFEDALPTMLTARDTLTSPVIDGNGNTDGLALDGTGFCYVELPGKKGIWYLGSRNGHIKKYSVQDDGTLKYENDYTLDGKGVSPVAVRGLLAKAVGNDVYLYFVTANDKGSAQGGAGGGIYWAIDTGGHNAPFAVADNPFELVKAKDFTNIKGMAWSPVRNPVSSVNKVVATDFSVYKQANTLVVEAGFDATVAVFNLLGVQVASAKVLTGEKMQLEGLAPNQVYVVKVGNSVKKVLL